jgi:acetoin utilization protein AcuB
MKTPRANDATAQPWTAGSTMTQQPITIGRTELLSTAHRLMRTHHVHHLPILEHGELIGVVSQRDLLLLEAAHGPDRADGRVEDAMISEAYAVTPDEPIATVAANMARHRYECAVVIERGRVIGIFTATDALRIVAALAPAPQAAAEAAGPVV